MPKAPYLLLQLQLPRYLVILDRVGQFSAVQVKVDQYLETKLPPQEYLVDHQHSLLLHHCLGHQVVVQDLRVVQVHQSLDRPLLLHLLSLLVGEFKNSLILAVLQV